MRVLQASLPTGAAPKREALRVQLTAKSPNSGLANHKPQHVLNRDFGQAQNTVHGLSATWVTNLRRVGVA